MSRHWLGLGSLMPFLVAVGLAQVRPQAQTRSEPGKPDDEGYLQTPAGFAKRGRPAVAQGSDTGTLRVVVAEAATGRPTFCRVNVVGADGNYYEPKDNPLAAWSLHTAGNTPGGSPKGPFRYYGWFFYTPGEFAVTVPAGAARVEVWKGFEYRPVAVSTRVTAGATRSLRVSLQRTVPLAERGYYSGDTHIHLNRTTPAEDERALDLLEAEDVRYGFVLCMNEPHAYSGTMSRQTWPQANGFGPASLKRRGDYAIASGQEYRCRTYGHICLLMHKGMVLEDATVDPGNWPVFSEIGRETRRLGGYSFHAHGGSARGTYADFVEGATDGLELLQGSEYRGLGLQGWYRILNVGYRFPAVAACDYPYSRALGDSRTYVRLDGPPNAADWVRDAARGRSFFTTGPLVLLEVDGRKPGDTVRKGGRGPHRVTARVSVRSEVAPVTDVELIVNGRAARRLVVPRAVGTGQPLELEETLDLSESSWVAARAFATAPGGEPDAEAHTNPVYVSLDGQAPYNQGDLDWLVRRLDEQIALTERRDFPEKPKVLESFRRSREELLRVRRAGGRRAPDPGG